MAAHDTPSPRESLPECDLSVSVFVSLIKQQQNKGKQVYADESKLLCSFCAVAQHICSFMPRSLLRLLLAAVFVAPSLPYVTAQLDRSSEFILDISQKSKHDKPTRKALREPLPASSAGPGQRQRG